MAQILYTDPGQFKFTIDIIDPVGAPRNPDGTMPDPVAFASGVLAAIMPLTYTSNTETVKSQQVVSEVTHKIVVRYAALPLDGGGNTLLRSRMLVNFRNRQFIILRIKDPDEMRYELHLICSERNEGQ